MLGKVLCAIGSGVYLVSISGGSNTLVECYKEYLGSGYMRGLLDYPTFDARLLKRCLQKTASTVFGTLDPFSMTEFIVTHLKGAEHRDWRQSQQYLRRAFETGDLCLPVLVGFVSNIFGVWPLIVSYLKETAAIVLWYGFLFWFQFHHKCHCLFPFSCFEKRDRWILLHRPVGENEVPLVPSHP